MYTRTAIIVLSAALMGGTAGLAAPEKPLSKSVQGVGVVIAIDTNARLLTINHEEIKDFMGPMQKMDYPVARPDLLSGLKPGDKIKFVIRRQNGTIVGLTVIGHAP